MGVNKFMARFDGKNVTILCEAASDDRQAARVYPESLKKKLFRLASLLLIKVFVTPFRSMFNGLLCCMFIFHNILIDVLLPYFMLQA